jgi:hypothetical protein
MTYLHYTPDLGEACTGSTAAPEQYRPSGIQMTLRAAVDALCEGFAAYREYERLRRRGVPHDAAIRESLGVGRGRAATPTADPLCFAGRA